MSFRVTGLDPSHFRHLWTASAQELSDAGVIRLVVNHDPGFPDRITLDDAPLGSEVLLLNHLSQPANTPFRACHAIYVLEGAALAFDDCDTLPPAMLRRPQSLRAFDSVGMMRDADVAEGAAISEVIERMFGDPDVAEIHAHNARQGCFMARITRT